MFASRCGETISPGPVLPSSARLCVCLFTIQHEDQRRARIRINARKNKKKSKKMRDESVRAKGDSTNR